VHQQIFLCQTKPRTKDSGKIVAYANGTRNGPRFHPSLNCRMFGCNPHGLISIFSRLCRLHQFCSELVHPKIVSDRLGHASVVITLDTYSAWIPSLQAKAAEAMT